jgi:alpha-tubulin suppressor-like RCC1 family protein
MIHAKSCLGPLSLLLVAVSACGSDASTGDAPPSATSQGDAGVADANASDANPFDAGTPPDAGASVDASSDAKSTSDAGSTEGGSSTDAAAVDAGSSQSANTLTIKKIDLFEKHGCALFTTGKVKCWGDNQFGTLGSEQDPQPLTNAATLGDQPGEMGDNLPYVNLGTGRTAIDVEVGAHRGCVLLDNNKVKCWGENPGGELGYGDTKDRGLAPGEMGDNLPYVDLGTGRTAKALLVARFHNCAILDNDKVKCWGYNAFSGELGLGNTYDNRGDEPNEMGDKLPYVNLGTGRTVKQLHKGLGTCATLDNGKTKCWGYPTPNSSPTGYMVGTKSTDMGDNLPYIDLGTGRTIKAMTRGCAVLDNDKVKCWGTNVYGELGLGDKKARELPETKGDDLPYVDLGTGRTARTITRHGKQTCAVLDNGRLKCWGVNSYQIMGGLPSDMGGALGIGDVNNAVVGDIAGETGDSLPYVGLGTGRTVTSASLSDLRVCALLDNAKAKCWGRNGHEEMGYETWASSGATLAAMGDALLHLDFGTK